jgi:t-SNARE complex subunit (syntaxin)
VEKLKHSDWLTDEENLMAKLLKKFRKYKLNTLIYICFLIFLILILVIVNIFLLRYIILNLFNYIFE